MIDPSKQAAAKEAWAENPRHFPFRRVRTYQTCVYCLKRTKVDYLNLADAHTNECVYGLEGFRANVPVGTLVMFYPVKGQPGCAEHQVASEPWPLGHGEPIVKISGKPGGVALWALEVMK